MSKILLLEKDINLDKRYINETDIISEASLETVITEGGGGGSPTHIRSSKVWYDLPSMDSEDREYDSIEGAAAAAGVTVEEFQQLLSGNVPMFSAQQEDMYVASVVTHLMETREIVNGDDVYITVQYRGLWYDNIIDQYWYEFSYEKYEGTETWTVLRFGGAG